MAEKNERSCPVKQSGMQTQEGRPQGEGER